MKKKITPTSIYLEPDLLKKIDQRAEENYRSRSQEITYLLTKALKEESDASAEDRTSLGTQQSSKN